MFPGWEWGSGGLHWSAGAAVTGQHGLRGSESTRSVSQPGGWKSAVRVRAGLAPEAVRETLSQLPRAGAAGGLGALRGRCAIQAASSW